MLWDYSKNNRAQENQEIAQVVKKNRGRPLTVDEKVQVPLRKMAAKMIAQVEDLLTTIENKHNFYYIAACHIKILAYYIG